VETPRGIFGKQIKGTEEDTSGFKHREKVKPGTE
jgi:hypothetical protein